MFSVPEFGSPQYDALFDRIRELAEPHYVDLPYHNFQHVEHTRDVGLSMTQLCLDNGVNVSPFVVEAAGLLHDADYHKPLPTHLRSKELRSSRIAGSILRTLGMPAGPINAVQEAIRATEVGKPCRTREAVIVRRADLDNTTSSYPSFLLNTYRLYREAERLTGSYPVLPSFLLGSVHALRTYYAEDLSLGPFDEMHEIEKALTNIGRLEQETALSFLQKVLGRSRDQAAS